MLRNVDLRLASAGASSAHPHLGRRTQVFYHGPSLPHVATSPAAGEPAGLSAWQRRRLEAAYKAGKRSVGVSHGGCSSLA